MNRKRVVVVGAGLGGLAASLRLAHLGNEVITLEKNEVVGGRNRYEYVNDCRFDSGPTLLMMLEPFRRLFRDVGEALESQLDLRICDPSYRVFYRDGSKIEGSPNFGQMLENIGEFAGQKEAEGFRRLMFDLRELYLESIPNFVERNFERFTDFAAPAQLGRVIRHRMLSNFWGRISTYFKDPRLRMLFSFQTMYLGLSPYQAPWVYATLTYMEYGEGIWYPMGGLPALNEAIVSLAKTRGADFRLNCSVARVVNDAVYLDSGEEIRADAVVINSDLPYAQRQLTIQKSSRKLRYSCSALMVYIDYEGDIPELLHHNVFFGSDYRANLEALFNNLRIPNDPAFYACISSKTDSAAAPEGKSNLYLLIPCPNLDFDYRESDLATLKESVFRRLQEETSFNPNSIRGLKIRTPNDWQSELNLEKGATFGLSHDTFQSAFMRPQNWSAKSPSVAYVGASTVPGNGLPMTLISAELAVDRLQKAGVL